MTLGWSLSRCAIRATRSTHCGEVARVLAERAPERVGLDVRLRDDVEPELVGELQERGVVGVVRGAHGVEPEALEVDQVGAHLLPCDGPPGVGVEVMAVGTVEQHPLAVDEQVEAEHLDAPEADADGRLLDLGALRVPQGEGQVVQARLLCRPRQHPGDLRRPARRAIERRHEAGVEAGPGDPVRLVERLAGAEAPQEVAFGAGPLAPRGGGRGRDLEGA